MLNVPTYDELRAAAIYNIYLFMGDMVKQFSDRLSICETTVEGHLITDAMDPRWISNGFRCMEIMLKAVIAKTDPMLLAADYWMTKSKHDFQSLRTVSANELPRVAKAVANLEKGAWEKILEHWRKDRNKFEHLGVISSRCVIDCISDIIKFYNQVFPDRDFLNDLSCDVSVQKKYALTKREVHETKAYLIVILADFSARSDSEAILKSPHFMHYASCPGCVRLVHDARLSSCTIFDTEDRLECLCCNEKFTSSSSSAMCLKCGRETTSINSERWGCTCENCGASRQSKFTRPELLEHLVSYSSSPYLFGTGPTFNELVEDISQAGQDVTAVLVSEIDKVTLTKLQEIVESDDYQHSINGDLCKAILKCA